ncbi:protein disulfide-isomerase [Flaviramulus basaltis]|uniref:Protein disulfide-isomerase n=1 Tax=Flaviramulus basaltis TaxID=369401 RepID=A0A1K2IM94_9FLAO|nr:thioredoxin family protein [Flaviramulus basaltis]SFZ93487.1 protein disulfide-isomerase [Flaviramulus basaltis]
MKKILFIFLMTVLTSANSVAQEKLTWHTDMNKAFEIASKENKILLLFFTGSDWCGWCIRLQNEVLKTSDFEKWAKDNVVLVELDFPRKTQQEATIKSQNSQMQKMFQVRGYPTVYFAKPEKTAEGKKNLNTLGSTGYVRGGAEKWLEVANNIVKNN